MERERPDLTSGMPVDPMQKAITGVERHISAKRFNPGAIQRALDQVRNTGSRVGMSPGEIYANLASLSGMAAEVAGQRGQEEDQRTFTEQQRTYQQTGELFNQGGDASQIVVPSQPQRTTGRASG